MGARRRAVVLVVGVVLGALSGDFAPPALAAPAPAGQCADSVLNVHIHYDAEAAGAGQRLSYIDFQNRGSRTCALRGAPGVSLVGHGNGTQIGRAAGRPTSGTAPTVHLAPGQSARTSLSFTEVDKSGGPFDSACRAVQADGYRIYPPHSYRAVFVKSPQYACSNTKVHWGGVGFVGAQPIGCAATDGRIPSGATRRSIADVDGDSLRDTEWITPTRFGITTASRATSSVRPDVSGGADPRALSFVLRNTQRAITLVAGSRDARVFRFARSSCSIRPVLNAQGHQYRFDLTNAHGDGTACVDPDTNGVDQVAGVRLSKPLGAIRDGDTVTISTTVVAITGLHAVNGRTRSTTATWPADRAAIEGAATITCRGLTIDDDGVASSS